MKKTILIVGGILAAAIAAVLVFYYSRKDRSMQQYVHAQSVSIVAVAVDDLLIDHISQFFKTGSSDSSQSDQQQLFKTIWNAGVHIPAHFFFFNLPDDQATFYSIQKITDAGKWQKFIDRYTAVTDTGRSDSLLHIGKHIAIRPLDKYILIRIAANNESKTTSAPLLENPAQWKKVSETNGFTQERLSHHLAYWHTDGKLSIYADIDDQQARLSGEWNLDSLPAQKPYVRHVNHDAAALHFWTSGSLRELPLLNSLLTKITGNETHVPENALDYVDLLVSNQEVAQADTSITYEYDEDFNPIAQQTITEQHVPLIESLWKVDPLVAQQLPRKMFYNFYLGQENNLTWLSTQQMNGVTATFEDSEALAGLQLNFTKWPSSWLVAPFTWLQEKGVRATIEANFRGTTTLILEGKVDYAKLAF